MKNCGVRFAHGFRMGSAQTRFDPSPQGDTFTIHYSLFTILYSLFLLRTGRL